jgi:chromate transporter
MSGSAGETAARPLGYGGLFLVFLKAGLAFGGGLGILAVLEDELVTRRRLVSREEFLTIYGIGRIVPSGTMTAVAVAYGHRFGGQPGILIALAAMTLPAFLSTAALTMAYAEIADGPLLGLLSVSVLPAALALIVAAALRLGRDMLRPSFELMLAAAGFAGALLLGVNPALLLVAGGAFGALVLASGGEKAP